MARLGQGVCEDAEARRRSLNDNHAIEVSFAQLKAYAPDTEVMASNRHTPKDPIPAMKHFSEPTSGNSSGSLSSSLGSKNTPSPAPNFVVESDRNVSNLQLLSRMGVKRGTGYNDSEVAPKWSPKKRLRMMDHTPSSAGKDGAVESGKIVSNPQPLSPTGAKRGIGYNDSEVAPENLRKGVSECRAPQLGREKWTSSHWK